MKIKFTLLSILSLLIFSSCSKQPDCDNEETIQLAKELILQEMQSSIGTSYKMIGIDLNEGLEKFVNENLEITNSRVNAKDENLKKCNCSSQISFKFPDDFVQKLESQEKRIHMTGIISTMMSNKLNYDYTVQIINKDEKLFVESIVPVKELNEVFAFYLMASVELNKKLTPEEITPSEIPVQEQNDSLSVYIKKYGIVNVSKSTIYDSSNTNSETGLSCFEGDSIYVLKLENGRYLFKYKENDIVKNGYIVKEDLDLN